MRALIPFMLLWSSALFGWSEADEERFRALTAELRCLVCQNQSIADSAAPLAEDLRRQVRDMMEQGKTDTEIRSYMVARYGDFVLYRPPLKPRTAALWLGPFVLLGIGIVIILRLRRAPAGSAPPTNEPDPDTVARLLAEAGDSEGKGQGPAT